MVSRFFLLIVIVFIPAYAQEDRVVARCDDYNIYESEFRERFDFSIHPGLLQTSDKLKAKHEFLEQLIAEKLLSLEAREKGYDTSEYFTNIITPLENMFVRDALYNFEIKNKTGCSPDEMNEGIHRINKLLKVKFIHSVNREELQEIYLQLKSGASFDSLLSSRIETKAQEIPMEITFGTMDKSVEDSVYRLKPGEFTGPLESKDGFYILKLIEVGQNPDLKGQDMVLEDIKRIIETRNEYKIYLNYYRNFFSKYKVTADKEIFEKLIKILVPKFKNKYLIGIENNSQNSEVNSPKYYLSGFEVSSAMELLDSDSKNKIFISLNDKPVKVKYFLNQLSHDGFYVKDISEVSIRSSLSSYIRKFIEDELLTLEANDKGMNNSPEVKKYVGMWKDSYLSKMLMVSMFDSIKVTEEEAYSVYSNNGVEDNSIELVNIVEVLTDDLDVVEIVLNEISNGKDIKDLARQYTKRDSLKDSGGEFGFFPVSNQGEIGRIASQMNVGDVYGPVKLDEGYSVFKLIDRKKDTTNSKTYKEIKGDLTMQLTLLKFEEYVNDYNAKLAQKYGVEIYEDVLQEIDNIFMNLVVVRRMGFGGEIFAVPYTEQHSGWHDIWLRNKELAQ